MTDVLAVYLNLRRIDDLFFSDSKVDLEGEYPSITLISNFANLWRTVLSVPRPKFWRYLRYLI
jgi:hypothetical protein